MKFVALVSGGKDSCYNILHCIKNGHSLAALANLHPVNENEQELDSFMFQTVGHDIVSLYGKCTGLPLFRQPIRRNSSVNLALNYSITENDEIEDLYELLRCVKQELSDVQAVSVGAILSSYQRTRVENVCSRLGLVVLSYLWQRDQLQLMQEMCNMSKQPNDFESSKMDARLIKVAALGLNETHLLKSLPEVFPTLLNLNSRYEVHICGEGGEFETMVLDAPFFTRGRLEVLDAKKVQEGTTGVCSARITTNFVPRSLSESVNEQIIDLPVPELEVEWVEIYDLLKQGYEVHTKECHLIPKTAEGITYSENPLGTMFYINNLAPKGKGTLQEQAAQVFDFLDDLLKRKGLFKSQILSVTLLLQNMENFEEINQYYNNFFGIDKLGPLPPSRACISTRLLPVDTLFQLSLVLDLDTSISLNGDMALNASKDGLHVQSISYWCPCNIGPYSQATWNKNDNNRVSFLSGQIALIPKSMKMCTVLRNDPENNLTIGFSQAVISLRHFHTLKSTIGSPLQLFVTCYISEDYMAQIVSKTWQAYCLNLSSDNECLLTIVKVSQLPRNAKCEWSGISCRQLIITDEDDNSSEEDSDVRFRISESLISSFKPTQEMVVGSRNLKRHYVTIFSDSRDEIIATLSLGRNYQATLFYVPYDDGPFPFSTTLECIPAESVYDYKGIPRTYALQIRYLT
ncbi:HBR096Wp [Eremothecium sinecaudum]|uniref:Diphthine--ammonia ligase n=1 Tax=Eremothecium sinecaudum TaxID=45286 RepID=A0A109UXK6_9SACH|nr:HBR096Wp [Eremothecium sinecaudum]AMD18997.1 HBR096Wp [Eremothecium sinecaudum]